MTYYWLNDQANFKRVLKSHLNLGEIVPLPKKNWQYLENYHLKMKKRDYLSNPKIIQTQFNVWTMIKVQPRSAKFSKQDISWLQLGFLLSEVSQWKDIYVLPLLYCIIWRHQYIFLSKMLLFEKVKPGNFVKRFPCGVRGVLIGKVIGNRLPTYRTLFLLKISSIEQQIDAKFSTSKSQWVTNFSSSPTRFCIRKWKLMQPPPIFLCI